MPQITLNNAATGLVIRSAINSNFTEVYTYKLDSTNLKPAIDVVQSLAVKPDTTTATYTLALGDGGGYLRMNSATAQTITVPLSSAVNFPIGTMIAFSQKGVGAFTIAATAGVTLTKSSTTLTSVARYGVVQIIKEDNADTWNVFGALA